MELFYDLLWKVCPWFLLVFLAVRVINLFNWMASAYSDEEKDNEIKKFLYECTKHKGMKRSGIIDDRNDQKRQQQLNVGFEEDRLKVVYDSGSLIKRVKYVDQSNKFVSENSEVNLIKEVIDEDIIKGSNMGESTYEGDGKREVEEGGEFSNELVGQNKVAGFEDKVGGKNIVDDVEEAIVGVEDRECDDIGGVLCRENVVDDDESEGEKWSVDKGEVSGRKLDGDEGGLSDEEDWEGIERSELEKKFARAMNFVECKGKEGRLLKGGRDLMMQLYGLEKIAMEGSCHEPQPMALKLSARAKWNAWQRLGNLTREDAMEQYVSLLSDNIPEWMEDHSSVERKSSSSQTAVDSFPEAD